MYIGVIYRPPNGDRKGALHEIDVLVKSLQKIMLLSLATPT